MPDTALNVSAIIADYLRAHGYDGLYCPDECACRLPDILPCGYTQGDCYPGYLSPCPAECGEHDWHVGPEKETEKGDTDA